ncbi:hypothetical protein TNCV_3235131 [Trichonephila clavipes]|nr:hypothetical protein TNCV_3235131 [Trichonephila clavipes]
MCLISTPTCGRGSLVVKVTDSWQACHEFEPSTAENTQYRGGRYTLNMSKLRPPPAGEVGEGTANSSDVLDRGSKLRDPSPITFVQLYRGRRKYTIPIRNRSLEEKKIVIFHTTAEEKMILSKFS